MNKRMLMSFFSMGLAAFISTASADDIDLYVGGAQITGVTPNVLLVLDNSSNWAAASQHWPDGGKQGTSELESLSEVIETLKGQDINVGLMMLGRDGGGLVRYAIRDMSDVNNVAALKTILSYMATNAVGGSDADEVASDTNYDDLMNSAFRYFNGLNRWKDGNGAAQDRRDYDGNANNTAAQPVFSPSALGNYALSGANSNPYNRPAQVADGCAKNFIIFIGNGFPQNITDGSDLTAAGALVGEVPNLTQIKAISPKNPYADEWARFMYQKGVKTTIPDPNDATKLLFNKIVTYTIDVCKDACDPSQETLLRSMATVGGGKYFRSTSKAEIKTALEMIFAEIQAVNSMFASASLPISVNTQGTFENQVYIGMFRPDSNARPRWLGNLKEYKFARYCDVNNDGIVQESEKIADSVSDTSFCATDSLKLYLGDRNNDVASDQTAGTGFIALNATSYWTTPETPGFWTFLADPVSGTDDVPDGPLVERGGAAFKLRNQFSTPGRNVYTCLGGCLTSGTALSTSPFEASNSTLVTKLTPSGTKTVTLSRSGAVVTATAASAHGFNNGDVVNIAGATPSDYNGAFAITTTGPTATTFTYAITEYPTGDTSGLAQVSSGAVTVNISSITINEATAVATVTTAANHGLTSGESATISNAGQSFLNGSKVVTVTGTTTFTYPVTLPTPASPATAAGTSRVGTGTTLTNDSVVLVGTSPRQVVVRTASNNGYAAGNSVLVASVTPAEYNGTWTISAIGTACPGVANSEKNKAYCFNLIKSPDGGSGMTMTRLTTPDVIHISRTVGSTTATAVKPDGSAFVGLGASATIAGSTQNAYNQTWSITMAGDSMSFTFGPVSLSPAAPSGTASASSDATVAPNALINWMRGMDVHEDENLNGSLADVRASIHGDVLHSRPLMLNFGPKGIVGFYGSNDGFLHAIKGGILDSDGAEKWAFIPEEFLSHSKLSRLYSNKPLVRYPNLVCGISPAPQPRDYFWDGAITAYQTGDASPTQAPSKSIIFASMRRGGNSIYALDVTDPDAPKFKWRISGSDTDYSALQQTWSEPKVARVRGTVGGNPATKVVLIFGSGYAAAEEDKPSGSARTSLAASGVYVVDAETGARLAFIEQPTGVHKYSFAADVSMADTDFDGAIDRLYAVDTGGNLFRFDANTSSAPGTAWTSYLIAQVGDVGNDGGADASKFLFPPELLGFTDPVTKLPGMSVFIGSGDREHPLQHPVVPTCPAYYGGLTSLGTAVQDGFYAVMDRVQLGTSPATVNAAPTVLSDMLLINADPSNQQEFSLSSSYKGWYLKLTHETDVPANASDLDEEKVVNAPRLVGGVLKFATNTPRLPDKTKGICSNLGDALNYSVNPVTGTYSTVPIDGGGLPPTITAGIVMIGGKPYYAEIGGGLRPTDPTKISQPIPGNRRKVYWYYSADPQ